MYESSMDRCLREWIKKTYWIARVRIRNTGCQVYATSFNQHIYGVCSNIFFRFREMIHSAREFINTERQRLYKCENSKRVRFYHFIFVYIFFWATETSRFYFSASIPAFILRECGIFFLWILFSWCHNIHEYRGQSSCIDYQNRFCASWMEYVSIEYFYLPKKLYHNIFLVRNVRWHDVFV